MGRNPRWRAESLLSEPVAHNRLLLSLEIAKRLLEIMVSNEVNHITFGSTLVALPRYFCSAKPNGPTLLIARASL
tara:strand:- start:52 stop:276 length:225 start_codon:yes stop_codon:yes gene_type:complete